MQGEQAQAFLQESGLMHLGQGTKRCLGQDRKQQVRVALGLSSLEQPDTLASPTVEVDSWSRALDSFLSFLDSCHLEYQGKSLTPRGAGCQTGRSICQLSVSPRCKMAKIPAAALALWPHRDLASLNSATLDSQADEVGFRVIALLWPF